MYEWDDEFYNEPSEFDMQVDQFKQTLMNMVKDEYKEEMFRLAKENEELQQVKADFDQIKQSYQQKERELERVKVGLKNEVRRERLKGHIAGAEKGQNAKNAMILEGYGMKRHRVERHMKNAVAPKGKHTLSQ